MEKPTEFNYLLNRMEHAGQQEKPSDHHYGTHRASLMRHVRALEKDALLGRFVRQHIVELGGGWQINQTFIAGAPSLEDVADALPAVGAA